MNFDSNLEKMVNIMKINVKNVNDIPDCLSSLEIYQKMPHTEPVASVVPCEANSQLPNIFLRTKRMPEVSKFIKDNSKPTNTFLNWNKNIDEILEIIQNHEVFSEEEFVEEEAEEIDMQALEKLIRNRI